MENHIINNKYLISKHIGSGKFGNVFEGMYKKTGDKVAIKIEDEHIPFHILKHEAKIMNMLNINNCKYIPTVFWFGNYSNQMCLIMTYYSCSLADYIKIKTISILQLDRIMVQMINILASIHKNGIIHRDIKPHNFMIKSGEIYLIDFGLSTFYIDCDNNHIPNKENDEIIGTPNYISYNIHNGNIPSRRDDIISIGYIYIYIYNKGLPWENMNIMNDTNEYNELHILNVKNQKRKHLKLWENNIQSICKNINIKIYEYLGLCYQYDYNVMPYYTTLNDIFTKTI
jgi:serine/threonine protein kinase